MRNGRRIGLGILLTLACVAATVWVLLQHRPEWYQPPGPDDGVALALAEQFEYGLVEQSQKLRVQNEAWSGRVSQAQINAWLGARLPRWIDNRSGAWPDALGTPQVRVDQAGVTVAVAIKRGVISHVLVARLEAVMEDGLVRVAVGDVSLGRISLPGEPLGNLLSAVERAAPELRGDSRAAAVFDVAGQTRPLDPVLELADGRRVRLVSLKLGDGVIDFTARTE